MPFRSSRRKFLQTTITGSMIAGAAAVLPGLESCKSPQKASTALPAIPLEQTALPYAFNALEPIIDARTMEIHYTKHAAAYAKAIKEAVDAEAAGKSLESL